MPGEQPPSPSIGRELSACVKLSKCLGAGVSGTACYSLRSERYLKDEARCDDFVDLTFNPLAVPYHDLLSSAMSRYIEAFTPYILQIGPDEFAAKDFKATGGYEKRQRVHRFYPANMFSNTMCVRAFGMDVRALAAAVAHVAEHVEILARGIVLIATSRIVGLEEADDLNKRIWAAINQG
jgi:hypothetical protein